MEYAGGHREEGNQGVCVIWGGERFERVASLQPQCVGVGGGCVLASKKLSEAFYNEL